MYNIIFEMAVIAQQIQHSIPALLFILKSSLLSYLNKDYYFKTFSLLLYFHFPRFSEVVLL